MQAFDSLILPSSRGYIKSIILDPLGPRAEDINYFVRSVASARELRWPLTSAGDPYSRPGTEVEVAGLINALSYHAVEAASTTSSTSLHVDTITRELNEHVITPLAVISALLPLLELGGGPSTVAFVVSLTASPRDLAGQALLAGMQQLERERVKAPRKTGSHARRVLLTTVEAQPTSLRSLFLSLLPSSLGGRAPLQRRQEEALAVPAKGQSEKKPIRPRNVPRHSSTSDYRLQRESEHRAILEAVTSIVLLPSTTTRLRSKYIVRLPTPPGTPALDSEQVESPGLERTVLLQIARLSLMPFALLGSGLTWIGLRPSCWLSSWTLPGSAYHGSRNAANSRPAYGPGPGPASNTHSRSCIRRGSEKTSNTRQPSRRPTSANSTSSSDAARSNERSTSGSGPSSTATASGPPSNNGLSSSGLLSSVPSSTFGDASEEDHYDYDEEVESPIHGSTHWASPVLSDRDSDTALGARPQDYDATRYNGEETTPSASRLVQGEGEVQYGFPSQASMQSTGDETWMGPTTTQVDEAAPAVSNVEGSDGQPAVGTQSPLGQSWVALGQSEAR